MQMLVRINGTLPDISVLGSEEISERAAEVKEQNITSNTSCSIFSKSETNQIFHILVDIGQGIVQSFEKGISNTGFELTSSSPLQFLPDAVLITHSHNDHIKELPILIEKTINSSKKLQVFCTAECYDQILKEFPQLSYSRISMYVSFNIVQPNNTFNIDQFSVTPILANHGDNYSTIGSVIYIVNVFNRKIIVGWDFLSLPDVDENLLWNPDLLILGTQNYNPHPETGMISVTDAYQLVRRWNAKECYLVHYSGLKDFEESKNQWFRGPVKAMTSEELQKTIDSNIPIIGGGNNKVRMTVAKEGMIWTLNQDKQQQHMQYNYDTNIPIGTELLLESLQKYVLKFEKDNKNNKLKLMIEDRIHRFDLSFDRPYKDRNNNNIVYAEGEKGMLATGPAFRMQVIDTNSQNKNFAIVSLNVFKGNKSVFKDDISINNTDTIRLRKYIKENF